MGNTVDGNANDPFFHGKIPTIFCCELAVGLSSLYTPVIIPQYNENFVTQYCDSTLVGSHRPLDSAYCFCRAIACDATHGLAMKMLSVRPSVRLSNACFVTK